MALGTAAAGDAAEIVGTVALLAAVDVGQGGVAMEGGAVGIEPGLAFGMTHAQVAVMAGGRRIPVGAIERVALIADRRRRGKVRRIMRNRAMDPGAFGRRDLAPGGAEVALHAADPRTSTQPVRSVATGAAVRNGGIGSVEGGAVGVEPGLTCWMRSNRMTIVAGRRTIAV